MIATVHSVSAEDVMALADGELSSAEAATVSAHIGECAECGRLAAELREVSAAFARWTVPAAPQSLEDAVKRAAAESSQGTGGGKARGGLRRGMRGWNLWATGGGRAIAVAAILIVVTSTVWVVTNQPFRRQRMVKFVAPAVGDSASQALPAPPPASVNLPSSGRQADQLAELQPGVVAGNVSEFQARTRHAEELDAKPSATAAAAAAPVAPMIAHSVSLTVQVSELSAARGALEALLARHRGYAAQLTVNTAVGSPRSLQGSLRVPDGELAAAVAELRALGHVETETQSGEEVTQQHADLVARLENSRETEQRLRAILEQRTGRIEDVLQVEEEIARVRGEIEQMEAEQKTLEHRVDFATVELQLTEQYREQLGPQSASVPMQIRNAFVSGLRHAANALLGILLFIEEVGPTVVIWLGILAVPGLVLWRRYRRQLERQ